MNHTDHNTNYNIFPSIKHWYSEPQKQHYHNQA